MPNRDYRAPLVELLVERQGPVCAKCGSAAPNGNPLALEIHHVDGNRDNNVAGNLSLLCKRCNDGMRRRRYSAPLESEGVRTRGRHREVESDSPVNWAKERAQLIAKSESSDKRLHEKTRVLIRMRVSTRLMNEGTLLQDELLDDAAEYAVCSQQTVLRELKKMCSKSGPAERFTTVDGAAAIRLKERPAE